MTLESIGFHPRELLQKVIQMVNAQEGIEQIKSGFENGDFTQVKKAAHKIKPSINMLRILEISEEVSELEKGIEAHQNSPRMKYIIAHIEEILTEVLKDLKKKEL